MKNELSLSELAKSIKPGKYRHFKGGEYEVLGIALHSETLEEMVLYKHIGGERDGQLFVRPIAMFVEVVNKPELGYTGPRFYSVS
jgi:hypothetical protein